MADFIEELKKLYKAQDELDEAEKARSDAYAAAGATIAAKQAEVTNAKKAVKAAAKI